MQTRKDTLCACSVLTRGAMLWGTKPVLGAQCSDTFQKVTLSNFTALMKLRERQ